MILNVWVDKDEDGVFITSVPELPGCVSQGKTLEEAEANIRDAIDAWLEYGKPEDVLPILERRHWTLEVEVPAELRGEAAQTVVAG